MIYLYAMLLILAMLGVWLGIEYLLRHVDMTKYMGPDDIWSRDDDE